jgi:hypothetical protein
MNVSYQTLKQEQFLSVGWVIGRVGFIAARVVWGYVNIIHQDNTSRWYSEEPE